MPRYSYDRLSAQDATFLWAEGPNQPMHVGAVGIFDAAPLAREDGGVDIDRFRAAVEAVLHWIPRYRQKIQWTPRRALAHLGRRSRSSSSATTSATSRCRRPARFEQLKELAGAHPSPGALDRRHGRSGSSG